MSGYKHKPIPESAHSMSVEDLRKNGYIMNSDQWLSRILFLETIAGVPGMVSIDARMNVSTEKLP